ncbi:hypothetical protein DH2020_020969 [Rehmannia glutinosa]|uniref:Aldehyde oxidase/xanthine dehydrogenase second molybdopterin binding domain-containing protein n=1 Tax=Rehmannia glutinosa TaxID=99300 RepID=A0ABR0WCV8_REHGL
MRAPGEVQASYIAEAILERVAAELSMEVDAVKNINFHTYESLSLFYAQAAGDLIEYTLPSVWDKVTKSSGFTQKIEMIENFNRSNIWRKRGISRVPIVFQVSVDPTPGKVSILWDGSIVVEVGGIEMGQGLWTKVKQVCAFALSSIECDGTEDLVEKVRVVQADTLSIVQGGFTSGSTTSEASCAAVRLCCNVLVERLTPLKEKLREEMGSVKWNDLILQSSSVSYLNYGAAVSEVNLSV